MVFFYGKDVIVQLGRVVVCGRMWGEQYMLRIPTVYVAAKKL